MSLPVSIFHDPRKRRVGEIDREREGGKEGGREREREKVREGGLEREKEKEKKKGKVGTISICFSLPPPTPSHRNDFKDYVEQS